MDIRNNLLVYLRDKYSNDLSAFYPVEEARQFLAILIQHFFGFSRAELAINPQVRLTESEILLLHFAIKDLKKYRPIQYITGKTEFLNCTLQVNESVLIPRPETEELVQLVVSHEKRDKLNVLDIGTGSGCIAIALEKMLISPSIVAIDVEKNALEIAAENAKHNNAEIEFFQIDILNESFWKNLGVFDVIVSNPPYVTEKEKEFMQQNVLAFEPHSALFVPVQDELIFYKKICAFTNEHLENGGRLYFEINEKKGSEIEDLLKKNDFQSIQIYTDFRGKPRFCSAVKSESPFMSVR